MLKNQNLFRKKQIFLFFELRPELSGQNDGVNGEGLADEKLPTFRLPLFSVGSFRLTVRLQVFAGDGVVDPLRVADVLQHDLALLQRSLAEPELEQLQVSDFAFRVVAELGQ